MSLRRVLLRIVHPVSAAFEPDRRPRPVHRGAVVFGPGEPEGGRPPTKAELAEFEAIAAEHTRDHDAAVETALRQWRPELEAAAERLVRGDPVTLTLGGWSVRARIVWFWRGDSLLEISAQGGTSTRRNRTRIPRDPRRLDRDVFVHYLVDVVADPP